MSTSGMSIDKNKPSILLMHGSGLTHIVWSLHEQFYSANGFNVLSVDLPGHGESEGPSLKSIESISDWVNDSSFQHFTQFILALFVAWTSAATAFAQKVTS